VTGRFVLLAGAVGLLLAAPVSHAGDSAEVGIAEYRFSPAELRIKTGTQVTWTNHEKRTSHSVFFLGAAGFESERLFPGESYSRTFDTAGSYPYTCGPHPEMKGVIEVGD
jgi:plastocyanin